ncbi:MAG TPA: hypothetical protein VJV03_13875, partial [Pyrinomonadaceae bacterium]|nr:hypothetical protein [Pyrinomonadaceae bacterium]
ELKNICCEQIALVASPNPKPTIMNIFDLITLTLPQKSNKGFVLLRMFRVFRGSYFCSLKNGSTNNTKRFEFDFFGATPITLVIGLKLGRTGDDSIGCVSICEAK